MRHVSLAGLFALTFAMACPDPGPVSPADAGPDAGAPVVDAGPVEDAGGDAGRSEDAGADAGPNEDAGGDAGSTIEDAGRAGDDAGEPDDAGTDAGSSTDAGPGCVDGTTQPGATACGRNGRGVLEQACVAGTWGDTAACLDPDDCIDGETEEEACGVEGLRGRACVAGQWGEYSACAEPMIASFHASPRVVSPGDDVTLSWSTRDATACRIEPGGLSASPAASGALTVPAQAAFTLTCEGPAGEEARTATVAITSTDWVQVSAANDHACGVKADGRLFCWGMGLDGRLGNNATENRALPVQEHTQATDWVQVSTGHAHSCGLKADGRVFCWGYGLGGALGFGRNPNVPVQEETLATDWVQIASGGEHSCGLKADGRLFCWGDTEFGSSIVQEPSHATDWAQVSVGRSRTCGLKTDGRLFCWATDSLLLVQEPTQATDWAHVSAWWSARTCGVKTDGRLFCWGWPTGAPEQEPSLATDWLQAAPNENHTCGLKTDGRLFCWGYGSSGQLGALGGTFSDAPVQEQTQASDWGQVATGRDFTCGLKSDGRLFCWGRSHFGVLGTGVLFDGEPRPEVTRSTDWAQLSAGHEHTCAVKADGRLFCWGEGAYGRLGNGSTASRAVPVQEHTQATDWARVSTGYNHTCAVKTDGRLFCWGLGERGALGNGSMVDSLVPVQESTQATDWVQVALGGNRTCGVKSDGRLFCWGLVEDGAGSSAVPLQEHTQATDWVQAFSLGYSGSCGLKSDGRLFCWQGAFSGVAPAQLTLANEWAQLSVGNAHFCGVKADGRLFCWGDGQEGRLGNNATADTQVPVQEHTQATDWAQVSAGGDHTCARKTDGRVFCWGRGTSLGRNSAAASLVPVQEQTKASDWGALSAGGRHSCALKTDGRLHCWGRNISGQLGAGRSFIPVWPTD